MKAYFTLLMSVMMISASAQGTDISYTDKDAKLKGYFVKASKTQGKAPGILILPAWMGIDEHSKSTAKKLSDMGYHAFVADIYGENERPKDQSDAGKKAGFYKKNFETYQSRIRAALDQLVKQGADPDKIVVIGYCFGGTGALEAARAGMPVKAVVTFHGGLGKDAARANNPIAAKVLVLHGAIDPYVPQTEVDAFEKEMNESKADWQMVKYSGAVHSFTNPDAGNDPSKGAAYNAAAAARSWEHFMTFLDEVLANKK
jgi:dienelactone hydrolase